MMRKSEYALWTLLVLAVLAAGSTMVGLARSETASAANSEIYRQLDLFGEVLERVRADYVEKPEDTKLIESAINGMLMGSTRIQPISIRSTSATCRCRRAANSAASASR
jgi:carboxyl-terminal processing protease